VPWRRCWLPPPSEGERIVDPCFYIVMFWWILHIENEKKGWSMAVIAPNCLGCIYSPWCSSEQVTPHKPNTCMHRYFFSFSSKWFFFFILIRFQEKNV
jgi:hypothetical protein